MEIVRTKSNKYLRIDYAPDIKFLYIQNWNDRFAKWDTVAIPFGRVPQLIRGLFSTFQRFQRRKFK